MQVPQEASDNGSRTAPAEAIIRHGSEMQLPYRRLHTLLPVATTPRSCRTRAEMRFVQRRGLIDRMHYKKSMLKTREAMGYSLDVCMRAAAVLPFCCWQRRIRVSSVDVKSAISAATPRRWTKHRTMAAPQGQYESFLSPANDCKVPGKLTMGWLRFRRWR